MEYHFTEINFENSLKTLLCLWNVERQWKCCSFTLIGVYTSVMLNSLPCSFISISFLTICICENVKSSYCWNLSMSIKPVQNVVVPEVFVYVQWFTYGYYNCWLCHVVVIVQWIVLYNLYIYFLQEDVYTVQFTN